MCKKNESRSGNWPGHVTIYLQIHHFDCRMMDLNFKHCKTDRKYGVSEIEQTNTDYFLLLYLIQFLSIRGDRAGSDDSDDMYISQF